MTRKGILVLLTALLWACGGALGERGPQRVDGGPRILHLPPERYQVEQGILTAIPIRLQVPDNLEASRVLVHYRVRGDSSWTSLKLTLSVEGWQGAIPCLEVGSLTGEVRYYIRVHDAAGRVIAYSGTRHSPYRIRIVHDSVRSEATLDQPRCPDPADCPPGLPGCPSEVVEKIPCESNFDCEGGWTCGWDGHCEVDTRRHTWLSLDVSQEFGWIGTTGACSLSSQEGEGTLCRRRSDDAIYYGKPVYTNEPTKVGVANTRLWLGVQHLLNHNAGVRLRAGYALLGEGPTAPGGVPFVPASAELSAMYWFGADPFKAQLLRPFVAVGIGYGMFDIRTTAHVRADTTLFDPQGGNDLDQTVDLWKRAGDVFVSVGPGVLAASESGWGVVGELSVAETFPFGAVIVSPRIGVQRGF